MHHVNNLQLMRLSNYIVVDLDDLNASSGCPFQPVPVPLPQSSIETTLSQLSTLFSAMFKNTTGITGNRTILLCC